MTDLPSPESLSSENVLRVTERYARIRDAVLAQVARTAEARVLEERVNQAPEPARRTEAQRDILRNKIVANPSYHNLVRNLIAQERVGFNHQAAARIRSLPDGFRLESVEPGLVVVMSRSMPVGAGPDPERQPIFVDVQARSGTAGELADLSRRYAYPTTEAGVMPLEFVEAELAAGDPTMLLDVVRDLHRLNELLVRASGRKKRP
ncbi:MAG TPA: hypothetical protein VLF40_01500 [Candidatus Saccharimonadales bacterium]|nr:hypothetical protein [Candidatus Saccharimonadales bacterium]